MPDPRLRVLLILGPNGSVLQAGGLATMLGIAPGERFKDLLWPGHKMKLREGESETRFRFSREYCPVAMEPLGDCWCVTVEVTTYQRAPKGSTVECDGAHMMMRADGRVMFLRDDLSLREILPPAMLHPDGGRRAYGPEPQRRRTDHPPVALVR